MELQSNLQLLFATKAIATMGVQKGLQSNLKLLFATKAIVTIDTWRAKWGLKAIISCIVLQKQL